MNVLVGIPTHKRPELLRQCLESIERQEGDLPNVRVFVADNDPKGRAGSKLAGEIAAKFRFSLTSAIVDEPGISAVRNTILEEARRSCVNFIAWIDDDETASPAWLQNLLEMQQVTGADIVGGPVEYVFPFPPPAPIVKSQMFWRAAKASGACLQLQAGGNFLISTQALSEADWPPFDDDFGLSGGEDSEWFARLSRAGLNFAWASDAVAQEAVPPERITSRWVCRRAYRTGNVGTRVSIKHRDWHKTVSTLAKAAAVLALAPLMAPLLVIPDRRLWLLVKWWRATGRFAALLDVHDAEYGERHAPNSQPGAQNSSLS